MHKEAGKPAFHKNNIAAKDRQKTAGSPQKKIQFLTEKKAAEQLKELKFRRLKAMEDSACQLQ